MKATSMWILLAVAILSGVGAFCVTRTIRSHEGGAAHPMSYATAGRPGPAEEVAWMKTEFGLSDTEMQKVEQLHISYIPRCDENCRRIELAGAKVARLAKQATGMNDDLAAAIREEEKARADCRLELMEHLYKTAAAMPPEAGKKFLQSAIPTVCPTAHPDIHGAMAH
ncbi:MAG: hypothetical protein J0M04_05825 [Verrucomicrobia bacterium]|nr:hypothetical protein [Verrucomicrobiota bacterium]